MPVSAHTTHSNQARSSDQALRVVLFSGGRGSGVLARQLVADRSVALTIAINGYDDGASTGEVRRFLGDSLGPSDFRKNASRMASELGSCPAELIAALDARLPTGISREDAASLVQANTSPYPLLSARAAAFFDELAASGKPFEFGDCSVGNLVFAGAFLLNGRRFNQAVDDYCALLGLAPGLIENVTDGTNAFLVGIDRSGAVLGSEEAIVDANRRNRIEDIYLIDRWLPGREASELAGRPQEAAALLRRRRPDVRLNPRLASALAAADLIVYAPGTQHSSLFPSYLTPGLSAAIAANLRAIKLLITNIQTDAEIAGSSAVDIIERAVYYLKEQGTREAPTPALITHYIINEPGRLELSSPYVPLGQIETLEDPRLVRIANYEDGGSGRHDAARILRPFLQSLRARHGRQRVAVLLHDAGSLNKIAQTLVELARGGAGDLDLDMAVFYEGAALEASFVASLPFSVRPGTTDDAFHAAVAGEGYDYVLLFESSGMYRGEDVVELMKYLALGRLDAAWGSRRLSVRDIEESLRLRYRHSPMLRGLSYAGSHLLSVACLVLYGRYVSDTLSGVRAVRASDALGLTVPLTHKRANQHLLAALLSRKANLLEVPVTFFPLSPSRVRRTSVWDGLRALVVLARGRLRKAGRTVAPADAASSGDPQPDRRTEPAASR